MDSLLYIPWFKLETWYIAPGLFGLEEGIPIQPFGILVAIAVLVGARISEEFGKRNGISPRIIADFVAHVVIVGFIGGFLLNVLFYYPQRFAEMWEDPSNIKYPGLSSFGGFIGAVSGALIWRHRRKMPILPIGDAVCFGFPFGWIFGRMGCFTVHDHPGAITDFPLAVADYQAGDPPYEPRHDLGLYDMIWAISASIVFLIMARKKNRPWGTYWATLPLMYAPIRFFFDYLRATDEEGGDVRYFGFTPGQYAAVALGLAGIGVVMFMRKHPNIALPKAAMWPPVEEAPAPASKGRAKKKKKSDA
jgi:phosphatidylglycerol:prolipoprotein diacylglycerol transferase